MQNKRNKTFLDRWLLNENLDEYTDPWKFARLNTVERILLAQKLENQAVDIVRNVTEMYMLAPTPRVQFDRLYDTGIRGLSLDEDLLGKAVTRSGLPSLGQSIQMQPAAPAPEAMDGLGGGFGGAGGGLGGDLAEDSMELGDLEDGRFPDSDNSRLDRKEKKPANKGFARKRIAGREFAPPQESAGGSVESGTRNQPTLGAFGYFGTERLSELRGQTKNLYRRLGPTQEWIENNYYQLLPDQQSATLVTPNRFWLDYAKHDGGTFLSPYFVESHRNFTEMMFAISVLDLPLKGPEQELDYAENKMTFTAAGPTIAFHQQVENAILDRGNTTILVSENFFQKNDRFRYEDGIRFDKFVSDEFHAHTLYGGQVVITNPTSTPRAVELLIQVPEGSIACSGSPQTKTSQLDLEAFSSRTFEYAFYFPTAGKFNHYPAHVSTDEKVLAIADPVTFVVTDQPAEVDKNSWAYVSQNGTDEEVIEFLNQQNILRIDLDKIAFRMKKRPFFLRTIETLRNRYAYNHLLWSYSIHHNDRDSIREFLAHADQVTSRCAPYLKTDLLTFNPVERDWYQHREYWPLINARAHQLGPQRKILNPNFFAQYQELMSVLAHQRSLNDDDQLAVTYYMLLQDRIESASAALCESNSGFAVRKNPVCLLRCLPRYVPGETGNSGQQGSCLGGLSSRSLAKPLQKHLGPSRRNSRGRDGNRRRERPNAETDGTGCQIGEFRSGN